MVPKDDRTVRGVLLAIGDRAVSSRRLGGVEHAVKPLLAEVMVQGGHESCIPSILWSARRVMECFLALWHAGYRCIREKRRKMLGDELACAIAVL
jgi:hypothetical protein